MARKIGPKVLGFRIKPNWRSLLSRAWSIKFMALAAILSGGEAVVAMVGQYLPVSNKWLALITFLLVAAACASRLVAQKNLMDGDC